MSGLEQHTQYYIRVKASNIRGESKFSPEVAVATKGKLKSRFLQGIFVNYIFFQFVVPRYVQPKFDAHCTVTQSRFLE